MNRRHPLLGALAASFIVAIACTFASTADAKAFDGVWGRFTGAIHNSLDLRSGDVTNIRLGGGPVFSAAFEGAKDYNVLPLPVISLRYRDVLSIDNNNIDFTAFDQVIDLGEGIGLTKFSAGP